MGGIVAFAVGFGLVFITMAPAQIVTVIDLDACYGPPPVALPAIASSMSAARWMRRLPRSAA